MKAAPGDRTTHAPVTFLLHLIYCTVARSTLVGFMVFNMSRDKRVLLSCEYSNPRLLHSIHLCCLSVILILFLSWPEKRTQNSNVIFFKRKTRV